MSLKLEDMPSCVAIWFGRITLKPTKGHSMASPNSSHTSFASVIVRFAFCICQLLPNSLKLFSLDRTPSQA